MPIRLVKATESDYPKVRKFIKNTSYHWMITSIPVEERIDYLNLVRFPPKPRFGRDGRIPTATEKFLYYSEQDYLKKFGYLKSEKGELLIIYDGDEVIGYLYVRPECKHKRIVAFPLEFSYQNEETVKAVVDLIRKKLRPNVKLFTINVGEVGKKLLENIPQIYHSLSAATKK